MTYSLPPVGPLTSLFLDFAVFKMCLCLPLQSLLKSSEGRISSYYQIDISAAILRNAFKINKRKCLLKTAYQSRRAIEDSVGLF